MYLHFIRHGKTTAPAGCLLGSTEVELNDEGRRRIRKLADRLPSSLPCLCSPMLRTRQTMDVLKQQGVAASVEVDERLREIDFGNWEMKTFADLAEEGVDFSAWQEYHHFCFPGGESIAEFTGRLQALIHEWTSLAASKKNGQLLIVTHGGVIRTMLCLLLGIDHKNYLVFNVDYGSWTTVVLHSGGGVLTGLNR